MNSSSPAARQPPSRRDSYFYFIDITSRWGDNDLYGHVNNVVYYAYFDTVINRYLIEHGNFDIHNAPVIGISPETSCRFYRSFAYPDIIQAGLRVGRLGNSSVTYEVGLFAEGENESRADGRFVHVFVDRVTQRPATIPDAIRSALKRIVPSGN